MRTPMPNIRPALQRPLAAVQGLYYLVTGLWPILHIGSFMAVTGPKEDLWLVQTVGALVIAIALPLLVAAATERFTPAIWTLGGASAAAFLLVDVVFYLQGAIGAVYLLDAVVELLLLVAWATVAFSAPIRTSQGDAA